MSDFEVAIGKAAKAIWPEVRLRKCPFHLVQVSEGEKEVVDLFVMLDGSYLTSDNRPSRGDSETCTGRASVQSGHPMFSP